MHPGHFVSECLLLPKQEAADEHDSCTNNMHNALGELGYKLADDHRTDYYTPAPFNLWMSTLDAPDESGFM